jgi:elongation factor G
MQNLTVGYRETVTGEASARGRFIRTSGDKPRHGDVEIRVQPLPRGSGFEFVNAMQPHDAVSPGFLPDILQGVVETLEEGVLAGFPVVDVRVTLTGGSQHVTHSTPLAFRMAASIALHDAVLAAGPVILMPVMRVEARITGESVADLQRDIRQQRGLILTVETDSGGAARVSVALPLPTLLRLTAGARPAVDWRSLESVRLSHYERVDDDLQAALVEEARKAAESSADG